MLKKLFTAMLLFISLSYANPSDKSLDELLVLSGITEQFSQFPDMIKMGMTEAQKNTTAISETKHKALLESVDKYILVSDIIENIRNALEISMTEKEIQELLTWYKSNLGKKITKAEEMASTLEGYQNMMASGELLLKDTKRVLLAKKLDTLIGATTLTIELQLYTAITTTTAILSIIEPNVPLDIKKIESQLYPRIMESHGKIEEMVILSFVYAYKDISFENLNTYINFSSQKTSMKMNGIVFQALNKGFQKSISKWAKNIAKIVIAK
ncbi:Mlr1501 protein [hydrothermal vent metagenome]|uniref:Mlr1501 protein n=1 Tax=hydrothermal vent metagenome TaxID=652676 RepID=A0A1W1CZF9_9ZZZZ